MSKLGISNLFSALMRHPEYVFRFGNHNSCHATVIIRGGDMLSFGWSNSHYCSNRFGSETEALTELELLFRAETVEVALTPRGFIGITEVRGWQTPEAVSHWIEMLEAEVD